MTAPAAAMAEFGSGSSKRSSHAQLHRYHGGLHGFSSSHSTAFASSTSSLPSTSSSFFARDSQRYRSASPTRLSFSSSARFLYDRPKSPGRSISAVSPRRQHHVTTKRCTEKRICLCSPTTHPGSFRCNLHRAPARIGVKYRNIGLSTRRSAMTNSLVRICGVEGDLVKRSLSALIRPSSHQQRRRVDFQPRPSRLSVMSKA